MGNIYYERKKRGDTDVDLVPVLQALLVQDRYEHLQSEPVAEITINHPFDQTPSSTTFLTPDKSSPLHLVKYSFPEEGKKIRVEFCEPTAFFLILKR